MRPCMVGPVLLGVLAIAPVVALSAQVDSGGVLVTSGTGRVSMPPTNAMAWFSVSSTASTAASAGQANDKKVREVLATLRAGPGVDSVWVDNVAISRANEEIEHASGYQATASIRVRIGQLPAIADVLDRALRGGATSIGNIQLQTDSTTSARRMALDHAFRSARQDAEVLATAAGLKLGELLVVSTGGGAEYATYLDGLPMNRTAAMLVPRDQVSSAQSGLISIAPTIKNIDVVATVSVRWRLVAR